MNNYHPLGCFLSCISYIAIFFKLISYHQTNYWYRENKNNNLSDENKQQIESVENGNSEKEIVYPDNIHLNDIIYFMCAPTLCYELNYPRNERIRIRFLMRYIIELVSIHIFKQN